MQHSSAASMLRLAKSAMLTWAVGVTERVTTLVTEMPGVGVPLDLG